MTTPLGAIALAALVAAAVALAAPPPNDDRANPQPIRLGDRVRGTTAEATRQDTDPTSSCQSGGGNVWYQFDAPRVGRVIGACQAGGDLAATVHACLREPAQSHF